MIAVQHCLPWLFNNHKRLNVLYIKTYINDIERESYLLIKDKGKQKTFCRKKADSDFPQDSASRHGLGSQSPSSRISLDPVAVPKCQGENREKKEKGMALRALHGTPWHSWHSWHLVVYALSMSFMSFGREYSTSYYQDPVDMSRNWRLPVMLVLKHVLADTHSRKLVL